MRVLRTFGVILSFLVLAAHFLRSGQPLLVLALLAAPLLLLARETWATRVLQGALLLGALEWVRTLVTLTSARVDAGEPFLRMALILIVVAAVAVLSALSLSHRTAAAHRPEQESQAAGPGDGSSHPPPGS